MNEICPRPSDTSESTRALLAKLLIKNFFSFFFVSRIESEFAHCIAIFFRFYLCRPVFSSLFDSNEHSEILRTFIICTVSIWIHANWSSETKQKKPTATNKCLSESLSLHMLAFNMWLWLDNMLAPILIISCTNYLVISLTLCSHLALTLIPFAIAIAVPSLAQ